jgi:hypothetical protein
MNITSTDIESKEEKSPVVTLQGSKEHVDVQEEARVEPLLEVCTNCSSLLLFRT